MSFWKRDDDFQAEIQSHIRLEADRLIAGGMPPAEAEAAARRTFGNVTSAREQFYESQRWMWLDQFRLDVRYGLRSLWNTPAFTAAAALTIALGVAANTAVFSLIEAVLLRSLPVENPSELVFLEAAGSQGRSGPPPYPWFRVFRSQTTRFAALAAFSTDELRIEIGGRPEQVMGQVASGNYFELLGLKPLLGRLFNADDERLNPPVAVISERYWRRRFGADPSVIGKSFTCGNRTFVIAGVMPAEFFGLQPGSAVDVTIPITTDERFLDDPTAVWLQGIVGRLRPGVSMSQAEAEANIVYRSFMASSRYPADIAAKYFQRIVADPAAQGLDMLRRRFSEPLHLLMGIAVLVLLLATANVANLLLSRGISRGREFAIRLAAGANRARIVRQLLTETILLFCLGAVPGLACAHWGVRFIEGIFREGRRAVDVDATLNWRVLTFSLAVTLAAGLAAGLFPAWRAFRIDPDRAIREGESRTGESRGTVRIAEMLVSFQVGLSLVLLVGALLFVRTLSSLRHVNTGFRGDAVLTMSLQAPQGSSGEKSVALWSRVLEAVRVMPAVRSAAVATYTPLSGRDRGALVQVRGFEPATSDDASIHINHVSEGYFATMGIALVRGRFLSEQDAAGAPKVALINEAAARKFFSGRNPIGETLRFVRKGSDVSYRIVGIVADTKHMNVREGSQPFAFLPMRQPRDTDDRVTLTLTSSAPGKELDLVPLVRGLLARTAPGILISDVITMRRQLDTTLLRERLLSGLSAVVGLLALILAAVGLYGVLSYRMGRQRRAIGIRMAFGASPSTVANAVLRQSGLVVALGLAGGLPFAVLAARFAGSMLWGVRASDPSTYGTCCGLLALVALVSAWIPARRAASVDPAEALRYS